MIPLSARERLLEFLKDDWSKGDVTAEFVPDKNSVGTFETKQQCFLAGMEEAAFLFESEGLKAKVLREDGTHLNSHMPVLRVEGSNKKIFAVVRTALNLASRMTGVATACYNARRIVESISPKTRVALTRKTTPGMVFFDKKAATLAGCDSHRLDLSGMVLLKDQHLKFFPSVANAIELARKKKSFTQKIEVEVTSAKQALEAAQAKPDVIMLDNFPLAEAGKTISLLRKNGFGGLIELSGGITMENLSEYVALKPDVISMGWLTNAEKAVDFSFQLVKR